MLTIRRETAVYTMSPQDTPAASAAGGDMLAFETPDCFGGQIAKKTDKIGALDWSRINAATGPVFLPIEDGCAVFGPALRLPEKPMIGVIGTAPADESIPTGAPSSHAGNMDCKRICQAVDSNKTCRMELSLTIPRDLGYVFP